VRGLKERLESGEQEMRNAEETVGTMLEAQNMVASDENILQRALLLLTRSNLG